MNTTQQPQIKSISETLQNVLNASWVQFDGNSRSITVDNSKHHLSASFNVSTLDFSCEFYSNGEFLELTESEENMIIKHLCESKSSNSSFSQSDYSHFESLIHKSN